jgi:hypothetical protein
MEVVGGAGVVGKWMGEGVCLVRYATWLLVGTANQLSIHLVEITRMLRPVSVRKKKKHHARPKYSAQTRQRNHNRSKFHNSSLALCYCLFVIVSNARQLCPSASQFLCSPCLEPSPPIPAWCNTPHPSRTPTEAQGQPLASGLGHLVSHRFETSASALNLPRFDGVVQDTYPRHLE